MNNGGRLRILVGVDFSACATRAVRTAAALARRLDGELVLLHVFPRLAAASTGAVSLYVEARRNLTELRDSELPDDLPVELHVRVGHPLRGLLDGIASLGPDLVVVGSHGRGGAMPALLGSVSERLARRSPVPVLVVPAERRATAVAFDGDAAEPSMELAWSCHGCGHILGDRDDSERCALCGLDPARWDSAPIVDGPVDTLAPSFGHGVAGAASRDTSPDPASLFPTAPPGLGGAVNPELRVRY